jgi:hypothetical protein
MEHGKIALLEKHRVFLNGIGSAPENTDWFAAWNLVD